jgi:anti-anti-sigma regulatory factor
VLIDVAVAASSQGRRLVTTNRQPQCRRTFEVIGVEGLLGVT